MNKFIDWEKLELKKTSGREKLRCPNCDQVRTDKTDKSLVIYHNDGVGKVLL
jgi:twinkle protein